MGNSFIGFPVPRAKIADMITGSAPPLIHKTRHHAGGDDVLDGTLIPGAGGVSLPFTDFHFNTQLESAAWYSELLATGGSIIADAISNAVVVNGTLNAHASAWKRQVYPYVPLTWAKNREFRIQCDFYAATTSTQRLEIGTGNIFNAHGFGFAAVNGVFMARCRAPSGNSDITIENWGATGYWKELKLRAKLTAGVKVEFWVNDILVATETVKIPTGTNTADRIIQITANNPAAGNAANIYWSAFQFWQAA